jgi:uncharacterized protein YbaR (Trm112 family)
LACPDDGTHPLELAEAQWRTAVDGEREIESARLRCPHCGRDFPVREGIPSFVPGALTVRERTAEPATEGERALLDKRRAMAAYSDHSVKLRQLHGWRGRLSRLASGRRAVHWREAP